jgi:hypothetical protein
MVERLPRAHNMPNGGHNYSDRPTSFVVRYTPMKGCAIERPDVLCNVEAKREEVR